MKKIAIYIADDHPIVTDGLRMVLDDVADITLKGVAKDGAILIDMLTAEPVDIVLLDLEMPNMNGIEACKIITERFPQVGVVILSMRQEISMIKSLLQSGAKGYVLKNAEHEEIISAIKSVHKGEQYISKRITHLLINNFAQTTSHASPTIFPALSRREKEVLELILDEYTSKEIAAKLSLSADTIETHRRRLLNKLNVRNTAGLVRIAVEHNLLAKS
ncbi:MAG: response regulator [Bacteroidia bacterium]